MMILGIETATVQAGCAIGAHEGVLSLVQSGRGRRHAENLAPAIEFACGQAQVELAELGAVAVDVGPGLFTGLRVGVATGKAIAYSLGIPMIGVSSLDLLAFPVRFSPRLIAAVIDARRGELYYAFYRHVPGGVQRLGDFMLGSAEELASEVLAVGDEVLMVGDGAIRYREHFEDVAKIEIGDLGLAHPSAGALVQLAHAKALREEFERPDGIAPLYLRRPDAEINWSTREQA